ncbi:MAG TPA: Uma2 family endonuclease [Aggregatilineales bacterium]|nr:Uma2 family endonuclease [Aggregatilineales bacterium]
MAIQTRKMTSTEFLAGPITNLPHELLNGEEIMSPTPVRIHQNTLGRLFIVVQALVPNGEVIFAPMDVYFDEENTVQPDLLWIAEGSACHWVENDKYLKGAPDLVVEILSPGSVRRDRKDKFRLYEKYGVREYWMIDPEEKLLEIWQLQDGRLMLVDVFGSGDPCKSLLLGDVDMKAIFPQN